uniref:Putative ATP-dependent helicase YprA isoform X2 n=1 Tax=Rhizophora mucronata TaxID=61149 RepID=A0A2P2M9Y9_RHIMU
MQETILFLHTSAAKNIHFPERGFFKQFKEFKISTNFSEFCSSIIRLLGVCKTLHTKAYGPPVSTQLSLKLSKSLFRLCPKSKFSVSR